MFVGVREVARTQPSRTASVCYPLFARVREMAQGRAWRPFWSGHLLFVEVQNRQRCKANTKRTSPFSCPVPPHQTPYRQPTPAYQTPRPNALEIGQQAAAQLQSPKSPVQPPNLPAIPVRSSLSLRPPRTHEIGQQAADQLPGVAPAHAIANSAHNTISRLHTSPSGPPQFRWAFFQPFKEFS